MAGTTAVALSPCDCPGQKNQPGVRPRLRAKVSEGSDAGVTSLRPAVHIPLFLSPFRKLAPEGLVSFLCLGDPAWSAKTLMILVLNGNRRG